MTKILKCYLLFLRHYWKIIKETKTASVKFKKETIEVWKIIMNANIDFIKDINERYCSLEYELDKKLKSMYLIQILIFFFQLNWLLSYLNWFLVRQTKQTLMEQTHQMLEAWQTNSIRVLLRWKQPKSEIERSSKYRNLNYWA